MFKKSKVLSFGTAPKPSYTIPVPPLSASARYAPLITAVELMVKEPITEEQKKMLVSLAESGSLKR